MSSSITLTAGVRQNLLSLQNTADLISLTQNRLATGKKVNSALDNPTSFFTSQSLNNRASDLNALLNSIGQAQKTLDAANTGLSSLTKLLQSAKSIAQQARQSSGPTAVSYGAISVNDTTQTETLGSFTGSGFGATTAGNITFDVKVNGTTYSLTAAVGVADADTAVRRPRSMPPSPATSTPPAMRLPRSPAARSRSTPATSTPTSRLPPTPTRRKSASPSTP